MIAYKVKKTNVSCGTCKYLHKSLKYCMKDVVVYKSQKNLGFMIERLPEDFFCAWWEDKK